YGLTSFGFEGVAVNAHDITARVSDIEGVDLFVGGGDVFGDAVTGSIIAVFDGFLRILWIRKEVVGDPCYSVFERGIFGWEFLGIRNSHKYY
ncbi:hypothetical protein, partial [Flammeovirga aprica]